MYYEILRGLKATVAPRLFTLREFGRTVIAALVLFGLWDNGNQSIQQANLVATQARAFSDLRERRSMISKHRGVSLALLRQADAMAALLATVPAEVIEEGADSGESVRMARVWVNATYCAAWDEVQAALDAADVRFLHSRRNGCGYLVWPKVAAPEQDSMQLRDTAFNDALARIDLEIASLDDQILDADDRLERLGKFGNALIWAGMLMAVSLLFLDIVFAICAPSASRRSWG